MTISEFSIFIEKNLTKNKLHSSNLISFTDENDFEQITNNLKKQFTLANGFSASPEIEILSEFVTKNEVTNLLYEFSLKKNENVFKYYIIKNADNMNIYASNSILKFLEEPPVKVFAFLFFRNLNNVIETIRSRCMIYKISSKNIFLGDKVINITKENIFNLSENLNRIELKECFMQLEQYYISNHMLFNKDDSALYLDLLNKLLTNKLKSTIIDSVISLIWKVQYANIK